MHELVFYKSSAPPVSWCWPRIIIGLAWLPKTALISPAHLNSTLLMANLFWRMSHRGSHVLTSPILSPVCPIITVIMLILLQHQRQVILFDPMGPFANACHRPYSYVYIMGLEESSWIFMRHCNWMLSMKWNTVLLEGCLPRDTNLNLHIARCIQIEVLQA